MAKMVPGKEEFYETLRYFSKKIQLTGVDVRLNTRVDAPYLLSSDPSDGNAFDAVILATGVLPRKLSFEGSDHPKVGCRVWTPRVLQQFQFHPYSTAECYSIMYIFTMYVAGFSIFSSCFAVPSRNQIHVWPSSLVWLRLLLIDTSNRHVP